jgi:hypothetical protein
MPDSEKSTLIEKVVQVVLRQGFGGVTKSVERFVKRQVRTVVLGLAGAIIILMGIAFISVGIVRWFALLMPAWLAWLIVGIVLFLLGAVLTFATLASSRH